MIDIFKKKYSLEGSEESKNDIKKRVLIGGGVSLVLLLLYMLFSGGSGSNPVAGRIKGISNIYAVTIEISDKYGREVKNTSLKSANSELSTVFTSDRSSVDEYYQKYFAKEKNVSATFSSKPKKEVTETLEEALQSNNIDSALKARLEAYIGEASKQIASLMTENPDNIRLQELGARLTIDLKSMSERLRTIRL
jgi:hypothetical protein